MWVDDAKRLEIVETKLKKDKTFNLERLQSNPLYKKVGDQMLMNIKRENDALDNSILWS